MHLNRLVFALLAFSAVGTMNSHSGWLTVLNGEVTARTIDAGRTNAALNWVFGDVFNANKRCWAYGVEFSGWAPPAPPSMQERHVVLVTPRHGITCNHAFGSPPGTQVVMLGTNGLRYTNFTSTTIGGLDDLRIVVFTN